MDSLIERMRPVNIEDEIRSSYLDYSMSVIVGRALPDVRDGLKPVHRRVLFAMSELGNEWNKAHKKSARVVGDVIGKFHPHGDVAVYDALVRMAQPWSLRYPLADGQGNFGSIDGDPPAAMRYTEVRMTRIASEMLADIEKETIDFQPNYDESTVEPTVLPARVPNLLVNGSSGIAVGMSTNIPPHNLGEVVDATIALIDDPSLSARDLMKHIPGPDFPTYGIIAADENLVRAYTTGRGIILVRGRTHVEENREKTGRQSLVITEIPYQLNKTRLIETIADLVRNKKIEGISDIRDESSRAGMRIVMDLKREANADIILRHLYKHTPLQSSFGIIMLAIVNGRPEVLNLKQLLGHFIAHRKEVITRRTRFDLRKAEERAHILEGFRIALDHLDEVIELIRSSTNPLEARDRLIARFSFTERQAQAILDLRLQRLTGMERDKILEEYREILLLIERLRALLADERLLLAEIKRELEELRQQFTDPRRTEIDRIDTSLTDEDLIPVDDMVVTISSSGYVKRDSLREYRSQRRGGRGRMGMATKDEDFVRDLFVASTHSYLLFFTRSGKAYWLKVYEVPQASGAAKGKPIVNLIDLQPDDSVAAVLPVEDFEQQKTIMLATRNGVVKRMDLEEFSRPRAAGVIAAIIDEGDEIISVRLADATDDVLLSTAQGMSIRFPIDDVRVIGRAARGVRGIRLQDNDRVIGMETVSEGDHILTVTARGYGKRTPLSEYRVQARAGQGIIDIKTGERNGEVVGMVRVNEASHLLLITDTGRIIRTPAAQIRQVGRNTWGVMIIRLEDQHESVTGVALAREEEEAEVEGEDAERRVAPGLLGAPALEGLDEDLVDGEEETGDETGLQDEDLADPGEDEA